MQVGKCYYRLAHGVFWPASIKWGLPLLHVPSGAFPSCMHQVGPSPPACTKWGLPLLHAPSGAFPSCMHQVGPSPPACTKWGLPLLHAPSGAFPSHPRLGMYREAERQFLSAQKTFEVLDLFLYLGKVYSKLDQPLAAVEVYKKVHTHARTHTHTHTHLPSILFPSLPHRAWSPSPRTPPFSQQWPGCTMP